MAAATSLHLQTDNMRRMSRDTAVLRLDYAGKLSRQPLCYAPFKAQGPPSQTKCPSPNSTYATLEWRGGNTNAAFLTPLAVRNSSRTSLAYSRPQPSDGFQRRVAALIQLPQVYVAGGPQVLLLLCCPPAIVIASRLSWRDTATAHSAWGISNIHNSFFPAHSPFLFRR